MAAATVVVGIAKLLLSGMVNDEEVRFRSSPVSSTRALLTLADACSSRQILGRLVLLYFASETADNPELRQCLSYFFPVYCYSNPQNQRRIASVRTGLRASCRESLC
jgi:condensin complex subunit 3